MDKLWVPVGFLIVAGLVFYGLAAYCYKALSGLYGTFSYYGVSERTFQNNNDFAGLIFKLKAEMFSFIVSGALSWMVSVILVVLLKRKKVRSNEKSRICQSWMSKEPRR